MRRCSKSHHIHWYAPLTPSAHKLTYFISVSVYMENYCLKRCAVFLCYYIFTASIMHVTTRKFILVYVINASLLTCLHDLVSTYLTDPQAGMGLSKCMEALQSMEIVWPSAGRALELLRGSKVNLEESELAKLSNHPDRRKRSAERPLDDAFERRHLSSTPAPYTSVRPQNFEYTGQGGNDVYDMLQGSSSSTNVPFYSSSERWPSDTANQLSFPATLSTSVLPQLYSTGLGDACGPPISNGRSYSVMNDQGQNHGQGRYPQYWNDYTTYPQLGAAYPSIPALSDQAQLRATQQVQQHIPYLTEHYSMYSTMSSFFNDVLN